jgi:hypothetical protein
MPKTKRKFDKIAFIASDMPEAVDARKRLSARYGEIDVAEADAIVALGGDGHMLQTLHRFMNDGIPIYGPRNRMAPLRFSTNAPLGTGRRSARLVPQVGKAHHHFTSLFS